MQNDKVSTFDTETLFRSVGVDGKGAASAAIDVGRFHESVALQGRDLGLTDAEITVLQKSFLNAYRMSTPGSAARDFEAAISFYEANYDLIHVRSAAIKAKEERRPIDRTALDRLYTKNKVGAR